MTVSITKIITIPFLSERGVKKIIGIFKLDFSGSYASGGDTINLSPYFQKVDCILPLVAAGYLFEPDITTLTNPATIKLKMKYPTKSQTSNLALSDHAHTHSLAYVKGTATSYVPDDSTIEGTSLATSTTLSTASTTLAHTFTGTKSTVDAGAAEEYPATTYPTGLSCYILVIGS